MDCESQSLNLIARIYFGVAGMFVLAISIILFFLIYQKRLLKEQRKLNQIENDYQNMLLKAGIKAQEEERLRIARDLHDSVGSLLSATKIYINQMVLDKNQDNLEYLRSKANATVDRNITSIRNITRNLMPKGLLQLGLIPAIRDLCRQIRDMDMLEVIFHYNGVMRLHSEKEVALYRILQELTNNTMKFAGASKMKIQITFSADSFELLYSDDGKGFDYDEYLKKELADTGLGLRNLESRVNFIGGRLNYRSAPGEGVSVTILLPIDT